MKNRIQVQLDREVFLDLKDTLDSSEGSVTLTEEQADKLYSAIEEAYHSQISE